MTTALLLALALAPPPTALAERVVETPGEVRRVSVFLDRTAVLSVRRSGSQPAVRRGFIGDVEWRVLLQVVEESGRELRRSPWQGQAPGEASVELRLAPPGDQALTLRVPVAAVPTLALARLIQALDGLELRLATEPDAREDLSSWMPVAGERVLLDDGTIATVEEIHEQGGEPVVHVRFDAGPLTGFLALGDLRQRAVRRVPQ